MARRVRTAAQREATAQRRDAQIEDARAQIAAGIQVLQDGEGWKRWLATAANLHQYSFGNQLLILSQTEGTARQVNGYRAWQALGRQVRKGERGIVILAPVLVRSDQANAADDSVPAQEAGERESARRLAGVKPTYVFDVAQTDGDPLPEPPRAQLLDGHAPPGLWDALAAQVSAEGFRIERVGDLGGANGLTDFTDSVVKVRSDVSDAQAVKTLAHELAHVALHHPDDAGRVSCRGIVEVEAESVAFTVAAAHQLPTDDYSFPYIAGWAASTPDPDTALEATARRVHDACDRILSAIAGDDLDLAQPEQLHDVAERALDRPSDLRAQAEATAETAVTRLASGQAVKVDEARPEVTDAHYDALADAQAWFIAQAEASEEWHTAVAERGLLPEQARQLGIGWAAGGWRDLCDALNPQGHSNQTLLDVGLARPARGGRTIDVLRNRVTFPYIDDHGRVTAFTGRIAGPHTPGTPKYLNTANWPGFTKGEHLLGLEQIGPDTVGLVLVEGPWDAAAVSTATGYRYVGVATNGTAFTRVQASQLAEAGLPVTMWTDPDSAGIATARNAYATIAGLTGNTINDPALVTTLGHDPSEYAAAFGPHVTAEALERARPLLDAVIDHTIGQCQGQSLHAQVDLIRASSHLIAAAPADRQVHAIGRLTEGTDLTRATVAGIVADAITLNAAGGDDQGSAAPVPIPPWLRSKSRSA